MIMITEYYYSRAGRFCQPHITKFRGKKKAARPSREEEGKPPPAVAGGGFRVLFGNRVEHELVRGGDLFVVTGEGHVEVRLRQLGGDEADERGDDEGGDDRDRAAEVGAVKGKKKFHTQMPMPTAKLTHTLAVVAPRQKSPRMKGPRKAPPARPTRGT